MKRTIKIRLTLIIFILLGGAIGLFKRGIDLDDSKSPVFGTSNPEEIEKDQLAPGLVVTPAAYSDQGNLRQNLLDGAKLVFVPSGKFQMGADISQILEWCNSIKNDCATEKFSDESPGHSVVLNDYWIYQQEVSNSMYRACVESGTCPAPVFTEFFNQASYANHPVVYVDWFSADTYCEWAGGRLPSEAEWEKAARGESPQIYPWGKEINCDLANYRGCSHEMTSPVESLAAGASIYGVLNMAGNVSEWTADWYDANYYQISNEIHPEGPLTGDMKVIRGGSWKNPEFGIRITNRGANFPQIFSTGIGFRCVLDP